MIFEAILSSFSSLPDSDIYQREMQKLLDDSNRFRLPHKAAVRDADALTPLPR